MSRSEVLTARLYDLAHERPKLDKVEAEAIRLIECWVPRALTKVFSLNKSTKKVIALLATDQYKVAGALDEFDALAITKGVYSPALRSTSYLVRDLHWVLDQARAGISMKLEEIHKPSGDFLWRHLQKIVNRANKIKGGLKIKNIGEISV